MTDPLVVEFEVACPVDHAFEMWVGRAALWWPRGHTLSGAPQDIVFEPYPGGRIYELSPAGEELAWGEVTEWEPPSRVRYLWHLFFDRSQATEVAVSFEASGDRTLVRIEQTGWERLGDAGPERRERTRLGWGAVTAPYREACSA